MKRPIVIIIVVSILGAAAYFLYRRKAAARPWDPVIPTGGSTGNLPYYTDDLQPPYKQGDRGRQILMIQAWLNVFKNETLTLDGIFGRATLAAVKKHFGQQYVCSTCYDMAIRPQEPILRQHLSAQGIVIP